MSKGNGSGHTFYLGYGIFLSPYTFRQATGYDACIGLGRLDDWRRTSRGSADIVPAPGAHVVGAVYQVPPSAFKALDRIERGYMRLKQPVALEDGTVVQAWVYTMTDETKALRPEYQGFYGPEPREEELQDLRRWERNR